VRLEGLVQRERVHRQLVLGQREQGWPVADRAARRRAFLSALCFVAGLGILMVGAIGRITLVGVLGFVVMLTAATIGFAAMRGPSCHHSPAVRHQQAGSMLDRFGSPWRRRHDDQS
jgi:hypothetical protein